jgi:hypothetical protein
MSVFHLFIHLFITSYHHTEWNFSTQITRRPTDAVIGAARDYYQRQADTGYIYFIVICFSPLSLSERERVPLPTHKSTHIFTQRRSAIFLVFAAQGTPLKVSVPRCENNSELA